MSRAETNILSCRVRYLSVAPRMKLMRVAMVTGPD
jgi:hypothetical protein